MAEKDTHFQNIKRLKHICVTSGTQNIASIRSTFDPVICIINNSHTECILFHCANILVKRCSFLEGKKKPIPSMCVC